MSNVYAIKSSEERQEEASLWIARLDRELTGSEVEELQRWMAADSRNEAVLLKMAEIWDKSHALSRLATVFPHTPVVAPAPLANRYGIAAAVLLAVFVGLWSATGGSLNPWGVDAPEMSLASQGIYETAIGDHSTVELSDGSRLDMNTNSRVRVLYSDSQRLIFLERGEINIEVTPDKSRPLSVVVGDRFIRAVGTAFNVRLNSSQEIELVVSHGKVLVGVRPEQPGGARNQQTLNTGMDDSGLMVEKGGFVVLSDATPEVETLAPEEIEVRLSWAEGNLIFRGEPLAEIVDEISRYTTVEFVFLDEDIKTVRVAGLFKSGDVAGFLATLQSNFNIVYEEIDDDRITLKSKVTTQP